jgi:hypothetical protein
MQGCRPFSRLGIAVAVAAALGGALACADSVAPDRSPDVIPNPGGISATEPAPNPGSDTSLPPDRLRGMVVATAPDSTATWKPVEGVRIEAAQRDTRTGAMVVFATTSSNDAGRFVFDKLDVPTGLVFVRAVPPTASGFRPSRWLAAYAFVGPWLTVGERVEGEALSNAWTLGPYLILERAGAPEGEYAPVLLIAQIVDPNGSDGDVPIAGARLVIDRGIPGGGTNPPTPGGTVASGRTDENGFVLIALPGPGLYVSRVTMPAESPYRDVPQGASFTTPADTDQTRIVYSHYSVGRR